MIEVIIISENLESREMLKTAKRLLGPVKGFYPLSLKSSLSVAQMRTLLEKTIAKINSKNEILLLTDLYGSTQFNVCTKFLKPGKIELVTGYNLPMLVKLGSVHQKYPLKKVVSLIDKYGKKYIKHLNSL